MVQHAHLEVPQQHRAASKERTPMKLLAVLFVLCGFLQPAFAQVDDGKTDDTAALQQLLNTRSAFSTLKIKAGATYRIPANLSRDKAIYLSSTIPGKPAILRYDFDPAKSPPMGRAHLTLSPRLGPPRVWKEVLSVGQRPN